MGLALSKVVAQIAAKGVPVLCVDTCSILDIMRDPTRNGANANNAKMTTHLLERLEVDGALVVLLAEQVATEFASHVDRIWQESQTALERLAKQVAQVDQLVAIHAIGSQATADTQHWTAHPVQTRRLAERWVASAVPVEQSDEIAARAYRRLNRANAPARQGKESSKDCLVIETYLEAIARLRQAGLQQGVVFLSSNVKDYTDGNTMNLRQELAAEFEGLGMEYAPNFGAAKRYLGL